LAPRILIDPQPKFASVVLLAGTAVVPRRSRLAAVLFVSPRHRHVDGGRDRRVCGGAGMQGES
jgi:hypothetical protein